MTMGCIADLIFVNFYDIGIELLIQLGLMYNQVTQPKRHHFAF